MAQAPFNRLPNELLALIFKELEGKDIARIFRVSFRVRHVIKNFGQKLWRRKCKAAIDGPTLQQILFKSSSNSQAIYWKQIYKSWYVSTYKPHLWKVKSEDSFTFPTYLSSMQVYKGYIVACSVSEKRIYLYSLENKQILETHVDEIYNFTIMEFNGEVYLVYDNTTYLLNIRKLEDGCLTNHHTYDCSLQVLSPILYILYSNNHIVLITYDDYEAIVLTIQKDSDKPNSITFQRTGAVPYDSRMLICIPFDERFTFWDYHLVVYHDTDIKFYSLSRNSSFSETSTIAITGDISEGFLTVSTSRTLFVFYGKHLYEIQKNQDDNYYVKRLYHSKLPYSQSFLSLFVLWPKIIMSLAGFKSSKVGLDTFLDTLVTELRSPNL